MKDNIDTKSKLVEELESLRKRISELESADKKCSSPAKEPPLSNGEEERDRLIAILESTTDMVATTTPDGQVLYINKAGRLLANLPGNVNTDSLHIGEFFPQNVKDTIFHTAIPQAIETGFYYHETTLHRRGGDEIPVSQVILSHKSSDGTLEYLSTIIRDISERKRAEKTLQESEKQFRSVIESSPMGVHMYEIGPDNKLVFIGANRAGDEILGTDNSQFVGKTIEEAFPPLAETEIPERYRAAAANGTPWHTSQVNYQHDVIAGAYDVYAFQTSPNRMAAMFLDTTERLKAEEQREHLEQQLRQSQKMDALGQLAGGIAHDFNNLLTTITGYVELIREELSPDDRLRGDVEEIRLATKRAANLTQQLLAFSRKQIISPRVIDINTGIDNIHKMIGRLIGENIDLDLRLNDSPCLVKADPVQIDQILINLVVNARDAMLQGGLLTITTENTVLSEQFCENSPDIGPGDYVVLKITDTGIGMDEDTLNRIFEPFFSTKGHEGTGLGLAIVYGVVKRYRGMVNIKSRPNAGTTVTVLLPRTSETDEDAAKARPQYPLTGVETILLVEDEVTVRDLTAKILTNRGYTVLPAENVEDAIQICRDYDKTIELLLTDVVMPLLNGRELYLRIREIRPDIKILYMSGYATDIIAKHGVLEKETTFVAKPFSVDALLTKVREALEKNG